MTSRFKQFYDRQIVPRLIDGACSLPAVTEQRRRVVPEAEGIVLEIGIGSGLNLRHYDRAKLDRVIGVDPDQKMLELARARAGELGIEADLRQASAEELPLDENSVDTALVTYALCSIPQAGVALGEVRRVLRPGGRLLFCEHGRSNRASTAKWQDRLTPIWKQFSGGCHLNRDVAGLIKAAGFEVLILDNFKLPYIPETVSFHYVGAARPR
jgi:ubiquinone/menaquinone biosynthesis C-methylase UbiE